MVGVVATQAVVFELTKDIPNEEAYEALGHDFAAIQYTLLGWFLTLVISATLGYGASLCVPR